MTLTEECHAADGKIEGRLDKTNMPVCGGTEQVSALVSQMRSRHISRYILFDCEVYKLNISINYFDNGSAESVKVWAGDHFPLQFKASRFYHQCLLDLLDG